MTRTNQQCHCCTFRAEKQSQPTTFRKTFLCVIEIQLRLASYNVERQETSNILKNIVIQRCKVPQLKGKLTHHFVDFKRSGELQWKRLEENGRHLERIWL